MLSPSRLFLLCFTFTSALAALPAESRDTAHIPVTRPTLDRSGKVQTGKASFYAREFAGKTMADGTPMNPRSAAAASRTLPLGTLARVRNLQNGRQALVEVRDRGPYVKGRIIDLTPGVARRLAMSQAGVVPVEVTPLRLPPPDGRWRPGLAASSQDHTPG